MKSFVLLMSLFLMPLFAQALPFTKVPYDSVLTFKEDTFIPATQTSIQVNSNSQDADFNWCIIEAFPASERSRIIAAKSKFYVTYVQYGNYKDTSGYSLWFAKESGGPKVFILTCETKLLQSGLTYERLNAYISHSLDLTLSPPQPFSVEF